MKQKQALSEELYLMKRFHGMVTEIRQFNSDKQLSLLSHFKNKIITETGRSNISNLIDFWIKFKPKKREKNLLGWRENGKERKQIESELILLRKQFKVIKYTIDDEDNIDIELHFSVPNKKDEYWIFKIYLQVEDISNFRCEIMKKKEI